MSGAPTSIPTYSRSQSFRPSRTHKAGIFIPIHIRNPRCNIQNQNTLVCALHLRVVLSPKKSLLHTPNLRVWSSCPRKGRGIRVSYRKDMHAKVPRATEPACPQRRRPPHPPPPIPRWPWYVRSLWGHSPPHVMGMAGSTKRTFRSPLPLSSSIRSMRLSTPWRACADACSDKRKRDRSNKGGAATRRQQRVSQILYTACAGEAGGTSGGETTAQFVDSTPSLDKLRQAGSSQYVLRRVCVCGGSTDKNSSRDLAGHQSLTEITR